MKALYCDECRRMKPLEWYKVVSCDCGLCFGMYVDSITGNAFFSERFTNKPKHLWVIGINNLFLRNPKPTNKEWNLLVCRNSMNFKLKTNIVKIRPIVQKWYRTLSSSANVVFVPYKTFIKL